RRGVLRRHDGRLMRNDRRLMRNDRRLRHGYRRSGGRVRLLTRRSMPSAVCRRWGPVRIARPRGCRSPRHHRHGLQSLWTVAIIPEVRVLLGDRLSSPTAGEKRPSATRQRHGRRYHFRRWRRHFWLRRSNKRRTVVEAEGDATTVRRPTCRAGLHRSSNVVRQYTHADSVRHPDWQKLVSISAKKRHPRSYFQPFTSVGHV
ncbi:MAG: hypothetical protein ACJA00_001807, partial [Myxococcota bacterium]